MNLRFVFLSLVALFQRVSMTISLGPKIVNGREAKFAEIPYQVSLQNVRYHICGGSIIKENYVITAAHCLENVSIPKLRVIAGTIDLKNPQSIHKVVKVIVNSEFDPKKSLQNDIGLVKVRTPFVMSRTISYVTLPKLGATVPIGTIAVTSGWGDIREGGISSKILQSTDVRIASQDYCNRVNSVAGMPVYDGQICIHNPKSRSGPCHGDSGGPLTVNGTLVGLTSWGVQCASIVFPTVFTRVSKFVNWIEANAV